MAISINFNICDNSPECSGIAVCDYGAIYWDETKDSIMREKGTLCVNNDKCISCGKCVGEDGCPVGAIIYAPTIAGLNDIIKEIHIDEEQVKTLFVDRYGAEPVDENICIAPQEIENIIEQKKGYTMIEEFCDDSIQCLLSSIPIQDMLQEIERYVENMEVYYYKCDVTGKEKEDIDYPILKIFKEGQLLGCVDGYYDNKHKANLYQKILVVLGVTKDGSTGREG